MSQATHAPRVRFAPSPTGTLHVGGARTALFNFLFARHHQGTFVLRIEDTDTARSTETALQQQLRDLTWLGLTWDEGISADGQTESGDYGPYRQSQRLALYQKYTQQLLEQAQAYYCFLTEAEIAAQKEACIAQSKPFRPSSPYRDLSLAQAQQKIAQGEPAVIRLKAPSTAKHYQLDDLVRGTVQFSTEQSGDFVLMRANGMPMYNFCCVIDDALMHISHVFRGEEHLPNTLRQLMLYDALQFSPPQFAHTSVILGPNGKKLSKRDGAAACEDFRQQGFLPAAMLNYIALLGWNDGTEKELFNEQELIAAFSVQQLNAAAPIFDPKKLKWINSQHLRALPPKQLWRFIAAHLPNATLHNDLGENWGEQFAQTFAPNFETLQDAIACYQTICQPRLSIDTAGLEVLQWDTTADVIKAWQQALAQTTLNTLNEDWFKQTLQDLKTSLDLKGKFLFMPLRVAMIGQAQGAELKVLVTLLPKKTLLSRANQCLQQVELQA